MGRCNPNNLLNAGLAAGDIILMRLGNTVEFPIAYLGAIAAGLVTFMMLIQRFESRSDALLVAAGSALVTALSFAAWAVWVRRHAISRQLTGPLLGQIPHDTNTSTFATPDSEVAGAYAAAARELEARTSGQVVLVTGAVPGQGTSRTALNLAAAATRAGRRVVLVDGDPTRNGLSRFGRTGASPGLAELARGESEMQIPAESWPSRRTGANPSYPLVRATCHMRSTEQTRSLIPSIEITSGANWG